nr:unnamed protein product [Callosobruchus analis]
MHLDFTSGGQSSVAAIHGMGPSPKENLMKNKFTPTIVKANSHWKVEAPEMHLDFTSGGQSSDAAIHGMGPSPKENPMKNKFTPTIVKANSQWKVEAPEMHLDFTSGGHSSDAAIHGMGPSPKENPMKNKFTPTIGIKLIEATVSSSSTFRYLSVKNIPIVVEAHVIVPQEIISKAFLPAFSMAQVAKIITVSCTHPRRITAKCGSMDEPASMKNSWLTNHKVLSTSRKTKVDCKLCCRASAYLRSKGKETSYCGTSAIWYVYIHTVL